MRACRELTGGSTVRRPQQGNQGKDAPRQPMVSSSLAAVAGSPRELFPCLNLSAVKWGEQDAWHVEGGWRALDES